MALNLSFNSYATVTAATIPIIIPAPYTPDSEFSILAETISIRGIPFKLPTIPTAVKAPVAPTIVPTAKLIPNVLKVFPNEYLFEPRSSSSIFYPY